MLSFVVNLYLGAPSLSSTLENSISNFTFCISTFIDLSDLQNTVLLQETILHWAKVSVVRDEAERLGYSDKGGCSDVNQDVAEQKTKPYTCC